ncbi:hypothetical protein FDA94_01675 [Herbidospora galbida]|uniref:Leucine rich repeat variant n=1 Tax=Herbidospora galbida TaxID=2575442 RepID=A0A4U3MSY1_9ACTN|nr:hypothetical protein [Herbidospora galbida]TKK91516.1 hypothetical protein FDA94_01675 [Herbidospora galbida]
MIENRSLSFTIRTANDLTAHRRRAPIPWVRATLAGNPSIGENLIRALATDRGHDVRRRLAHHPEVPLDVLSDVAGNTRIGQVLLPRIASASGAEIMALAASAIPAVRMLLAQRRDPSPEIRGALADDPDAKVVTSVAPHPGLSEAQLRAMVARHGARVLARVAVKPGRHGPVAGGPRSAPAAGAEGVPRDRSASQGHGRGAAGLPRRSPGQTLGRPPPRLAALGDRRTTPRRRLAGSRGRGR